MNDKAEWDNVEAELRGVSLQTIALCIDTCSRCAKSKSRWRWLLCRRCSISKIREDVDKVLRMLDDNC